ncbi:MAG: RdgB/HAM1 family non-canonical purine NTP pyrophosphatase [bacterium TMED144]|nr:MAG: RdgB/HAM1 family non-canonical purine NTP pyrophosphatase [bacterium TMED144]
MQIVLATHNKGKMSEINNLLSSSYEVMTLDRFPKIKEIPETGKTLKENAFIKARTVFEMTGLPSLADDTGLEVKSLGGDPGVFSARYAGEQASYQDNCQKLLKNMMRVPKEDREAKFRTVIAYKDDNRELSCDGSVKGEIAQSPKGSFGFGYDSVFYYPPLEKTFAELSEEEKNSISHRGRALRKFLLLFNDKK